jgi:hypothetical protein
LQATIRVDQGSQFTHNVFRERDEQEPPIGWN